MAAGIEQLTMALLIGTFTVIVRFRLIINVPWRQLETNALFALTTRLTNCGYKSTEYACPTYRGGGSLARQYTFADASLVVLAFLHDYELLATCSKYNIDASQMSENNVKQTSLNVFSQIVDSLI